MEIFNQLGDLILSAVPTVIFVLLFYFFMRWSFFGPIERVLSERNKRALRKARGEIFAEQEAVRRRVLDERQAAISTARLAAQQELQGAKKALAADVEAARAQLEQSSAVLASEIAEAILAGVPSGPGSGNRGEAR